MNTLPILIILLLLATPVTAVTLEIGTDENNLSTFTFNHLIEKIKIEDNNAQITDVFSFLINEEELNQSIPFTIYLPNNDGRNLMISNPEYIICTAENKAQSTNFYNPEKENWAIQCNDKKSTSIPQGDNLMIHHTLDLQTINWGEYEIKNERRTIFVQVKYNLENFVVENEGEYEYIPVQNFQTSKPYIPIEYGSKIYLVMSEGTILESTDNFKVHSFDERGRAVLEYTKPLENSVITFRDSRRLDKERLDRDLAIIGISLALTITFGFLFSDTKITKRTKHLWMLTGTSLLITTGMLLYGVDGSGVKAIILLLSFILFLTFGFFANLSRKKDLKGSSLKRDISMIKKFICQTTRELLQPIKK